MTNSKLGRFLFKNTSTSQTIAKNTLWLSFGEITGRLLRVVLIFFAARILGTAGWGTFSYMASIAAILTVFSDVGLSAILIREGSKSEELRKIYFATSFFLKIAVIAVSFLLIILVAPRVTNLLLPPTLVYAAGVLMVFDALRVFGNAVFRSRERMQFEAGINILTQIIIVSLGFYVLFNIPAPEFLAVAYAIGSGVGLIAVAFLVRKYIRGVFKYFRKDLIKKILSYSWPIGFGAIFGGLMVNIDTVMVGWFWDASYVGLYAAAQKPIAFLYLLPGFIAAGLLPTLAKRANKDNAGFRKIMERGLAITLLVAFPIVVGILLTAGQIVDFVYGAEYFLSSLPMRILATTLLLTFPAVIIAHSIFAYNRQKEMVPVWILGALFNIAANLTLIPAFGIAGAAWASLLTQVGVNGFLWRKMRSINFFSVGSRIWSIAGASLLMALFVLAASALGLHILVVVLIASLAYLLGLAILRDKTLAEIRSITSA